MKEVQPILDPNGVYSGKRTCAELGVSYKTLQKYRENGYIRQHNPENTTRPRYTGKSIMDCWKKVSALWRTLCSKQEASYALQGNTQREKFVSPSPMAIQIFDRYTHPFRLLARIKASPFRWTIKERNHFTAEFQHKIISIQEASPIKNLIQKDNPIRLFQNPSIFLFPIICPKSILIPERHHRNQFQFRQPFFKWKNFLCCEHVKSQSHAT